MKHDILLSCLKRYNERKNRRLTIWLIQGVVCIVPDVNIRRLAAAAVVSKQMGTRSTVNAPLQFAARAKVLYIAVNARISLVSF